MSSLVFTCRIGPVSKMKNCGVKSAFSFEDMDELIYVTRPNL